MYSKPGDFFSELDIPRSMLSSVNLSTQNADESRVAKNQDVVDMAHGTGDHSGPGLAGKPLHMASLLAEQKHPKQQPSHLSGSPSAPTNLAGLHQAHALTAAGYSPYYQQAMLGSFLGDANMSVQMHARSRGPSTSAQLWSPLPGQPGLHSLPGGSSMVAPLHPANGGQPRPAMPRSPQVGHHVSPHTMLRGGQGQQHAAQGQPWQSPGQCGPPLAIQDGRVESHPFRRGHATAPRGLTASGHQQDHQGGGVEPTPSSMQYGEAMAQGLQGGDWAAPPSKSQSIVHREAVGSDKSQERQGNNGDGEELPKKGKRASAPKGRAEQRYSYIYDNYQGVKESRGYLAEFLPVEDMDEVDRDIKVLSEQVMEALLSMEYKDLVFVEELVEREVQSFDRFFEDFHLPAVVWRCWGLIMYASDVFCDFLQCTKAEAMKENIIKFWPREFAKEYVHTYFALLQAPQNPSQIVGDMWLLRRWDNRPLGFRAHVCVRRNMYFIPSVVVCVLHPFPDPVLCQSKKCGVI